MRLSKRLLTSGWGLWLLSGLAATYVRFVGWTTRWRYEVAPGERLLAEGESAIAAFWHGRLLMMPIAWRYRQTQICMMVSGHRDGALSARTIRRLNMLTVGRNVKRGGPAVMRQMKRCLDEGNWIGITPDGPRGPRMRAKPGALKLAQLSGRPVVPVTLAVSRRRILSSWDRFQLALPFGRGIIACGEPIRVPRDADEALLEALRQELETVLNDLTADLDRRCGVTPVEPAPALRSATDGSEPPAAAAAAGRTA